MPSFTHVAFCYRLWLMYQAVLYTCHFVAFLLQIMIMRCLGLSCDSLHMCHFCYRLWDVYHAVPCTCVISVTDYELCIMRFFAHVSSLLQIKKCVSCGSLHVCPFCYRLWDVYHAVLCTCVISVTDYEMCIMRFFAHVSFLLQIMSCVLCGSLHTCLLCYRLRNVYHAVLYTCVLSVTDYDRCVMSFFTHVSIPLQIMTRVLHSTVSTAHVTWSRMTSCVYVRTVTGATIVMVSAQL